MKKFSAEHLLNLMSEAYPGLVTYINKELRYEFVNKEYYKWFHISSENILGKKIEEVLGKEIVEHRKPLIKKVFQGETVKFTTTLNHKDLGVRDVEQVYKPDIDSDGNVIGFIGLAYDITEQKIAERAARENEARFSSLTNMMPQLVWVSDAEGNVEWLNEKWCRVTGTTMEENLGDGWIKTVHPDDRASTMANWKDGLQSFAGIPAEYRMKMADGSYRWHMARALPITDEKGKIVRWVGTTTDIDDQKKARTIAEREREKIYSLFMQAPVTIAVTIGPDHIFQMANPASYKYFPGFDVIGKKAKDVFAQFEAQGFDKILGEIYNTGVGRSFTSIPINITRQDGTIEETFADSYYEPIRDENGFVSGILHMSVDVTQRVNALKRAEESENLFRNYVESMPQMAFTADRFGNITYFNQQWVEFFGRELDLLKAWEKADLHHPDDLKRTIDRWNHSLKTGEPYQIEYRLKRHDGVYRWHLGRAVPLRDSKGSIIQWVGTNTDIHDQKEIESYQTRLLQVLESSSDFIGMADIHGQGIYLNKAGQNMLGLDEVPADTILDCFMEEDREYVKNVILPTTVKEGKWVGDFRFKNIKTGKPIWVHYNSFITHDEKTGEVTGFATVSRDITDLKQKEMKLEEALKARDHFLSIASHELKTPLTSLKLQAQLTLRNITSKKEISYDKILAMAIQNNELVDRLTLLIDDMLDVSRINTGKLRLNIGTHELGDIVREVVFRMGVLFEAAGLKLPSIFVDHKFYGEWDRFRLEQVVGNLLTNAIRYGRGKDIDISITGDKEYVTLAVKDQGYGISKEDQKRIFERFERAINSAEVSGLGLGLFISREIVEAHGGKIWVESELNKGSVFYVKLPSKCVQES